MTSPTRLSALDEFDARAPIAMADQRQGGGSNGTTGVNGTGGGEGAEATSATEVTGKGGDDGNGKRGGGKKGGRSAWRRVRRALLGLLLFIVLLIGGAIAALAWIVHTESGTRFAWTSATRVLHGKLGGTLDGGTLQEGVRLHDVFWNDGATSLQVDRLAGRWNVTRAPWRLTVDYLRVGNVTLRLTPRPSTPGSSGMSLPRSLKSPLQLDLKDLRVEKIAIHSGTATTVIENIALHGGTDGQHHSLMLDRLDSPYGRLQAHVQLDGTAPFATTGGLNYQGTVNKQDVNASATLSGSLTRLIADVNASGMKLAATAHIEATPFDAVPVRLVSIAADHLNPQALNPSAPAADLRIRASLQPVSEPVNTEGAATSAPKAASPTTLVVAGPVSITNASPGGLDAKQLPLMDASAFVRLDAVTQRLDSVRIRLLRDATLTGGGSMTRGTGTFAFDVAKLDLHTLHSALRPTQFAGKLGLSLNSNGQTINATLKDPGAAIGLRAKVESTATQTTFDDVQLDAGQGRVNLTGTLKRDAASSFAFKANMNAFDPMSLVSAQQAQVAKTSASTAALTSTSTSPKGHAETVAHRSTSPRARVANTRSTRRIDARISGSMDASGTLAPTLAAKLHFALRDSVYDGIPMTGTGTLQLAGQRLLPSQAQLSVAGNQADLHGSFGTARDRLIFAIDAPQLERLGFGLAGKVVAQGDVTGSIAHPNVTASYQADGVVFGSAKVGHAEGRAQLHDGAAGALNLSVNATNVQAPGLTLQTLMANVAGTRGNHTVDASARGSLRGNRLDAVVTAHGALTDGRAGMGWRGTVSQLRNRGTPSLNLVSPVEVVAEPRHIELSATSLTFEGATLNLGATVVQDGEIRSKGSVRDVDLARVLALQSEMTGKPSTLVTDLQIAGDWDLAIGKSATGHIALQRTGGDIQVNAGQGPAGLGLEKLAARLTFDQGNRAQFVFDALSARVGTLHAQMESHLSNRDGVLTLAQDAALSGAITGDVPSLRNTGGLLGPTYILDGSLALRLALAGTVGKPKISGSLTGTKLGATLVDQGIQLGQGVVDILIAENLVTFRQVEFHGSKGTLSATGQVQLDAENPNVTAKVVADKLELFGAPDRQLSISGQATVANAGSIGGLAIDGTFGVDHALFDLPKSSAPKLGDDVVVVRSDGHTVSAAPPKHIDGVEKPVGPFAPRANIVINLGNDFRFRGAGANLRLTGALTVHSAPNVPLSGVGDVSVTPGSTYEAFGRRLGIETGFFTFNGPIDNPAINLLAMRRNQEVEAGVRVRGTLRAPDATLVSEPSVPDDEKLSWLLFGHGLDSGSNLGQENTMAAALALVGSAGGKRIAQTVGLDEFTIGTSDNGLTDAQVVSVAKALNEHFVLGYEQGLQSAGYLFKLTWLLSRRWSVATQAGTYNGASLNFTARFD